MATLAYPYPNLFPYIESKCLWSYSVDGEEHKEFKEPLSNWDYNASLEIKCKLTWDIRDILSKLIFLQSLIIPECDNRNFSRKGKYAQVGKNS